MAPCELASPDAMPELLYGRERRERLRTTGCNVILRPPNSLIWDDRLPEGKKGTVAELNASLERLDGLRAVEINVSGPFLRSKIAWKLATYQHALLHRIVALIDGVAVAWNARSTLAAILTARAFMETYAIMADFEKQVERFLCSEDLHQLDTLAQNGIFATRDPELCDDVPDVKAKNILTFIDKLDTQCSGFRKHYDILSERCHPNAMGHNSMFSILDRSTGTVRYTDEREPQHNGRLILTAIGILPAVESIMAHLDERIREVSDLQHRISPAAAQS